MEQEAGEGLPRWSVSSAGIGQGEARAGSMPRAPPASLQVLPLTFVYGIVCPDPSLCVSPAAQASGSPAVSAVPDFLLFQCPAWLLLNLSEYELLATSPLTPRSALMHPDTLSMQIFCILLASLLSPRALAAQPHSTAGWDTRARSTLASGWQPPGGGQKAALLPSPMLAPSCHTQPALN